MVWAGTNWKNGILVNGRRYQRDSTLAQDIRGLYDQFYNEDLYRDLW